MENEFEENAMILRGAKFQEIYRIRKCSPRKKKNMRRKNRS